jgi:HEAT repeat protein
MDFRIPAPVQITILVLLFSCSAAAQGDSSTPTPPQTTAHAIGNEPSIQELEEKSWLILQEGLHNKRVAQRVEAVKAISLLQGNRQAVRFALRALRDKNPKVRAAAAVTLGELNATVAIPALKAMLSDKDALVTLASAHALYVLKDPVAYEIYYAILMGDKKTSAGMIQSQVDRLKDPKQMAQIGLQEGISFVPYAGMGYEAYRQLMKHDSAPVRAAAARFLALDPDSISEDALIQAAVADKDVIVREAALDALSERSDPKCIERLAINLDETKYPVRYRTAATIIRLASADRRKLPAK